MSELFTRGKKGNRGAPSARDSMNVLARGQEIGPFTSDELKAYNSVFCQNGLDATRSKRKGVRTASYKQGTTKAGLPNKRCNKALAKTRWQVRWVATGSSMIRRTV